MVQAYPKPVAKVERGLRRSGRVTPAWQRYLTDPSFRWNFEILRLGGNGTLDPLVDRTLRQQAELAAVGAGNAVVGEERPVVEQGGARS
jgi:hypothetical protein